MTRESETSTVMLTIITEDEDGILEYSETTSYIKLPEEDTDSLADGIYQLLESLIVETENTIDSYVWEAPENDKYTTYRLYIDLVRTEEYKAYVTEYYDYRIASTNLEKIDNIVYRYIENVHQQAEALAYDVDGSYMYTESNTRRDY